jgi:hypothetical protein
MKTYYIAGPMRGYPKFNFPAFYKAEEELRSQGFSVINPARMDEEEGFSPDCDPASVDSRAFFDRDVTAIRMSNGIIMLPGWEKSIGATAEMHIAKWLGKEVLFHNNKEEDILEEALRLTTVDRNQDYGPPEEDFQRTGELWSVILNATVGPKEVALCMIALKISRAMYSNKRDHWTDMAGYARCGFLCSHETSS